MNTKTFRFQFLFFLCVFLVSCEKPCEDPGVDSINSIYLKLKSGGENGFTQEELNSTYLVRYLMGYPTDSLNRDTTSFVFYEGSSNRIRIGSEIPWKSIIPPYYTQYTYIITNTSTNRKDTITNIDLIGDYTGDCKYVNSQKQFIHKYIEPSSGELRSDIIDMAGNVDYYVIGE